jgi:tetratricopeptide (TPR) repeat protein
MHGGFIRVSRKRGMRAFRIICLGTVFALCLVSAIHCTARAATKERSDSIRSESRDRINISIELDRASRLVHEKQYEQAIPILERISLEFPRVKAAAELLSQCYLKTGRPQDAVNLLEALLRSDPRHFNFARDLGHAYLDLGEKEKAVEAWERMLTDEEKSASYYGVVAKLEQEAGLYEEALRTYGRGRRFERHFQRYSRDMVRLLRLLGRHEEAFREGLAFLTGIGEPAIEQAPFLTDIFREAGTPPHYIVAVDSAAAASTIHARFFAVFAVLLLVEAERYDEAWSRLGAADAPALAAKEFYSLLNLLANTKQRADDDAFRAFFDRALDGFLERHGDSPIAPGVLLIAAWSRWENAHGHGAPDKASVHEMIALIDRAITHPFAAAFIERAMYLKALMQLDGLHSPEEAFMTLERAKWRGMDQRYKAEELRVRAGLATMNWPRIKKWLDVFIVSPDSTIAALGRYGLGKLAFLRGDYDKSVEILSGLAEAQPSSKWANDALETAMMVRAALNDGGGGLDLYRAAILAGERGELAAAIDSLEMLEVRHPHSVLGPRALFLRAGFEESAGRRDGALRDFSRLAERYALHELAPRALERVGLILAEGQPEEAEKHFKTIMERYPNDPFLERVRMRYMALRRSSVEEGE